MSATAYEKRQNELRRLRLIALIDGELQRATARHSPMHSPHEGHSVIREELDELWDHVKADTGRSREAMVEAVQIATMALRYVYDLGIEPLPEEEESLREFLERFTRVSGGGLKRQT